MSIIVLNPGPLTTVQDLGRFGYQASGIPCSGVMDQASYHLANKLVGNTEGEAVLEFTMYGGTYRFVSVTRFAVSGADMNPRLNGTAIPMNQAVPVKKGSVFSLNIASTGCRTYLAVAGGIDVPPVLGSRSTNLKCHMGGYQGRALQAGDVLPIQECGSFTPAAQENFRYSYASNRKQESGSFNTLPEHSLIQKSYVSKYISMSKTGISGTTMPPSVYPDRITVRVIEGPQEDYFTEKGKHTFFSSTYIVSSDSDRMGCRLEGPSIESYHGTDIISDGIVFGSIQVTSAGLPIILLADRQTTGGYAKIGTVCSADLPLLAQSRPGNTIRFEKITVEKAQQLIKEAI